MAVKYFEVPEDLHDRVRIEAIYRKLLIRDAAKEATEDWLRKQEAARHPEKVPQPA